MLFDERLWVNHGVTEFTEKKKNHQEHKGHEENSSCVEIYRRAFPCDHVDIDIPFLNWDSKQSFVNLHSQSGVLERGNNETRTSGCHFVRRLPDLLVCFPWCS